MTHLGTADRHKVPGLRVWLVITACGVPMAQDDVALVRDVRTVDCPDCRASAIYAQAVQMADAAEREAERRRAFTAAIADADRKRATIADAERRVIDAAVAWLAAVRGYDVGTESDSGVAAAAEAMEAATAHLLALRGGA